VVVNSTFTNDDTKKKPTQFETNIDIDEFIINPLLLIIIINNPFQKYLSTNQKIWIGYRDRVFSISVASLILTHDNGKY